MKTNMIILSMKRKLIVQECVNISEIIDLWKDCNQKYNEKS